MSDQGFVWNSRCSPPPWTLVSGSLYRVSTRSPSITMRRPSSTTARKVVPLLAASSRTLTARSSATSIAAFMEWVPANGVSAHNIDVPVHSTWMQPKITHRATCLQTIVAP